MDVERVEPPGAQVLIAVGNVRRSKNNITLFCVNCLITDRKPRPPFCDGKDLVIRVDV